MALQEAVPDVTRDRPAQEANRVYGGGDRADAELRGETRDC